MHKRGALLFEHTYIHSSKRLKPFLLLLDLLQVLAKLKIDLKLFISQNIFITAVKSGDAAVNDMTDSYNLRSLFCQCSPGLSMTDALKKQSNVLH